MKPDRCPKCDIGKLQRWDELSEEEQEVVRHLPASVEYPAVERAARHRWCTRCWFEASNDGDLHVV